MPQVSNTYSFEDVGMVFNGPGGGVDLSAGVGIADEGVTASYTEDKATMVSSADGGWMHSLHASKTATVTIRLLKTSPANQQMNEMFNYQTTSSALYGRNNIVVRDPARGDLIVVAGAGFRKHPDVVYSVNGNIMEWTFNCGRMDVKLGDGNPVSSINSGQG